MSSQTAQAEEHRDPLDGTAVIPPVTDAMMDHAAHEAAVLADGVAHRTIALDRPAAEAPEAFADAMSPPPSAAEPVREAVERADDAAVSDVPEPAARPADEAPEAVADAISPPPSAAEPVREAVERAIDAVAGAEPAAEAAPDAPAADALGRYNAKMFEMMRANAASATALFAALVQAKSVPEALSLNADHLRRQVEILTSQGRELATLAQRIALDALQPPKGPTDR